MVHKSGQHLNRNKTYFISFFHNFKTPDSSMHMKSYNESIQQASTVKFLGLEISETCKWNIQIDSMCKRVSTSCITRGQKNNMKLLSCTISLCYVPRTPYFLGVYPPIRIFRIRKRILRVMEAPKTGFL